MRGKFLIVLQIINAALLAAVMTLQVISLVKTIRSEAESEYITL